jgi:hypothetical protein
MESSLWTEMRRSDTYLGSGLNVTLPIPEIETWILQPSKRSEIIRRIPLSRKLSHPELNL